MAVRVIEVQAAAAVAVVDLVRPGPAGVGLVRQALLPDAAERRVELLLADEERVVLGYDLGPSG